MFEKHYPISVGWLNRTGVALRRGFRPEDVAVAGQKRESDISDKQPEAAPLTARVKRLGGPPRRFARPKPTSGAAHIQIINESNHNFRKRQHLLSDAFELTAAPSSGPFRTTANRHSVNC